MRTRCLLRCRACFSGGIWLSPVVLVPYVPALGPVQPKALSAELFNAVVDVADTDLFLPYDKDRRWSGKKDERVIVDEIVHEPGLTVIPTFTRGRALVKIYHYGDSPPRLSELTQWTRTRRVTLGSAAGRVIWFQGTLEGARTRLLLKIFGDQDKRHRGEAIQLTDCAVADTFPAFAEELGAEGFAFLYQRIKTGLSDGPILVRVEDQRVVGAVGPMGTLLDSTGTRMQPPQYSPCIPTTGAGATAGRCGGQRWRGARTTGPSTRSCKPLRVVHQSCSICPKACPHSVSCAAGKSCRRSPNRRLLVRQVTDSGSRIPHGGSGHAAGLHRACASQRSRAVRGGVR